MLLKTTITTISSLFIFSGLLATSYYLDPVNGDINNSGSLNDPLPGLELVIEADMIQSNAYSPLPYVADSSFLVVKNQGALIQAGDTLFLMDGLHGEVFLRGYFNEELITIMSYDDHTPILKSIRIQAGANWSFDGLTISSEPYEEYINYRLVYFETHGWHGPASEMTLKNCLVYSAEEPWDTAEGWLDNVSAGVYASGDNMSVINNEFRNVSFGVTAGGLNAFVSRNSIINFSKDGMRLNGSDGIYEYNLIKNCYKVDDNHDDAMQSFTTNGLIVDRNIVRSNIIINSDDPNQPLRGTLQGIGCFDGFYHDWVIENNVIFVDHYHGISLYGAKNCKIVNNTVLDPTPDITPGAVWVRIHPHKDGTPSSDNTVANNVSNRFIIDGGDEINNISIAGYSEYAEHFVDYLNDDFHLLPTSSLIDGGDPLWAPEFDIEQNSRFEDLAPDIGAYEFQLFSSIDEETKSTDFLIYPNPTNDLLHIESEIESKYLKLQIFTACGQIVENFSSFKSPVELNHLSPGLYLVQLIDQYGLVFNSSLVKL